MSSITNTQSAIETGAQYQGRLRNTFLLALLPISIVLILLMGGITYLRARTVIQGQVNTQLNASLESLATNFDQWLTTKFIRMDLAVRRPPFQEALHQIISGQDIKDESFFAARELLLNELNLIKRQGEDLLFNQFFITSPEGLIIVSTKPEWENQSISGTDYFLALIKVPGSMAVYNPAPIVENDTVVITSIPNYTSGDTLEATIFGLSGSLSMIGFLEEATLFNPDARGYIITQSDHFINIDPYQLVLTFQPPSEQQIGELIPLRTENIFGVSEDQYQIVSIESFDGTPTISNYTTLPALKSGLVIELPEDVAFGELNLLGPYTFAVASVLGIIVAAVIWVVTQRLVGPLRTLTQTTQQFAQGNWDERSPDTREDEIGLLSHTFNVMADDLSDLYRSLESQVLERTSSLEKRSQQFEATAQVAREASAIRNLDELLNNTTELISGHFGYYHAGIFLVDEVGKYAILQAANSQGGQRMLERSHRLEVGQVGVVGNVAATGLHRIALDVGEDPIYFDNPDLPETRSELALPLLIQDQVIGVLDVQSKASSAFEPSDVEVLQILADQIALAIENTRLLEQSQVAIEELQHAYGAQTKSGWARWLQTQTGAYYFDRIRVSPIPSEQVKQIKVFSINNPTIQNTHDGSSIILPITLRDQKLGTIVLRRDPDQPQWNSEDLNIVRESVAQIAIALDNARLLDETRKRAEHEQTVSDISTKLSRSFDVESILRTAVRELGQLPNVTDASVHIRAPKTN